MSSQASRARAGPGAATTARRPGAELHAVRVAGFTVTIRVIQVMIRATVIMIRLGVGGRLGPGHESTVQSYIMMLPVERRSSLLWRLIWAAFSDAARQPDTESVLRTRGLRQRQLNVTQA
jgi:hypothetical protein